MENCKANWERYMQAWSETDHEKRIEILKEVLDPNVTYADPVTQRPLTGYEAIGAYIGQTQQMIPGVRLEITSYEQHHNASLAEWNMCNAAGAILSMGKSFARYGADDKIIETMSFFALE